jgi:hypothetical protein
MLLEFYPTLTKAFKLMVIDNVASPSIVKQIFEKASKESLEPVGVFDRAEEELSKLTVDQLYEVCCGDQDECVKLSQDSDDVLLALFEMI